MNDKSIKQNIIKQKSILNGVDVENVDKTINKHKKGPKWGHFDQIKNKGIEEKLIW